MRAFHADPLGEQSDLAIAEHQLLQEIRPLELLARFPERQGQQVLLDQGLARRLLRHEVLLDLVESDLLGTADDQHALHQVAEFPDVARPGVVPQAVLGRHREAPERHAILVHQAVHVMSQQVGDVLRVLAQRRDADRNDLEVGEQVAPHTARRPVVTRQRRGDESDLEWNHRTRALALPAALLEVREQEALGVRRQVLDAAEEQRATPRLLVYARLRLATGGAAAQARRGAGVVEARATDGDEGTGGARAERMHVAGECLAAGAGLADQHHRGVVAGDLLHLLAQLLHDAALADRRDQRRDQCALRLAPALACLQRPFRGAQELGDGQRLFDEVEGAEACGLDRGFHGAVPGQHDDRAAQGVLLVPLAQQRDAVHVGHPDVEQHEVRLLARGGAARGGGVGRDLDLVTFLGQDLRQQAADVGLVVDDQYSRRTHAFSLLASARRASRAVAGNVMRTRAPPCGALSTSTWPPCSSTIRRTIASPRPVPFGFEVTYGSKACSSRPPWKPGPLSTTVRATRSPTRFVSIMMTGFGVPSSASSELVNRLLSSWRMRPGSASSRAAFGSSERPKATRESCAW